MSDGEVQGGEATFEWQQCPRGAVVKFEGVATFERVAMFDVCRGDDIRHLSGVATFDI